MEKETLTVEKYENGIIIYRNADGERHNQHGPALVYADGDIAYYIKGQLHNENGPAVVFADGHKSYYINGQLHNPNGPALVYPNRDKYYYINGEELTEAEFKAWQSNNSEIIAK
jgi:hypothetical protein